MSALPVRPLRPGKAALLPAPLSLWRRELLDQDGLGALCCSRFGAGTDKHFARVRHKRDEDAIADRDAFIDPVAVGIAVFSGAIGRHIGVGGVSGANHRKMVETAGEVCGERGPRASGEAGR